jgi:hypothetical protein
MTVANGVVYAPSMGAATASTSNMFALDAETGEVRDGSDRPRQFAAECAEPATSDEESAFSAYVLSTWPLVFII